jgi:hypothetical protein
MKKALCPRFPRFLYDCGNRNKFTKVFSADLDELMTQTTPVNLMAPGHSLDLLNLAKRVDRLSGYTVLLPQFSIGQRGLF